MGCLLRVTLNSTFLHPGPAPQGLMRRSEQVVSKAPAGSDSQRCSVPLIMPFGEGGSMHPSINPSSGRAVRPLESKWAWHAQSQLTVQRRKTSRKLITTLG